MRDRYKTIEVNKDSIDSYIETLINFRDNYNHNITNIINELISICNNVDDNSFIVTVENYLNNRSLNEKNREDRFAVISLIKEFYRFVIEDYDYTGL